MGITFLYKFGKREHLEQLQNGSIRFMSAAHYQKMEQESGNKGIGDVKDSRIVEVP